MNTSRYRDMEMVDFLEDSQKRKRLTNLLLNTKNKPTQKDLFKQFSEESLDLILDNISSLIKEKKPLYQRWFQKTGDKKRLFNVPKKPLRKLIDIYLLSLIKIKQKHDQCHGGEKEWSVKKSLETHLPCKSTLSFDLENAFENINIEHVFDLFYELLDDSLSQKERNDFANFLSIINTVKYSDKRGLPQGSPCSMALFNRVLYSLDEKLSKKSIERNLRYSRWVDDITISSQDKKGIEYFLGAIELAAGYFSISKEKIFFQDGNEIYLLGHEIKNNIITKNTKEEKLRNKVSPLNFDEFFKGKSFYDSWKD